MSIQSGEFVGLNVVSGPTSEPLTLVKAKAYLRVDVSEDDTLIGDLISAARELVEHEAGIILTTRTVDYVFDGWPAFPLVLPYQPVQSVTSVSYLDANGVSQVWPDTAYAAPASFPRRIVAKYGQTLPIVRNEAGSVQVRAVVGYPDGACPARACQAIAALVAHWYANPEAVVVGAGLAASEIPWGIGNLINALRWDWS